jgi:hypothetical protein
MDENPLTFLLANQEKIAGAIGAVVELGAYAGALFIVGKLQPFVGDKRPAAFMASMARAFAAGVQRADPQRHDPPKTPPPEVSGLAPYLEGDSLDDRFRNL